MTNKEKYKKAFSTLHASGKISLEVEAMENRKKTYKMKKAMAACAAVAVMFGSMTMAYAADIGGIQQKITAWMHGEQTEVNITSDGEGSYSYTYTDQDGEVHERGGGGMEIDAFGNQRPLSAEEVLAENSIDTETKEDGSVWFYYYDKHFEVTDLFGEDGDCRFSFKHEGETIYCKLDGSHTGVGGSYALELQKEAPKDAASYTLVE